MPCPVHVGPDSPNPRRRRTGAAARCASGISAVVWRGRYGRPMSACRSAPRNPHASSDQLALTWIQDAARTHAAAGGASRGTNVGSVFVYPNDGFRLRFVVGHAHGDATGNVSRAHDGRTGTLGRQRRLAYYLCGGYCHVNYPERKKLVNALSFRHTSPAGTCQVLRFGIADSVLRALDVAGLQTGFSSCREPPGIAAPGPSI